MRYRCVGGLVSFRVLNDVLKGQKLQSNKNEKLLWRETAFQIRLAILKFVCYNSYIEHF